MKTVQSYYVYFIFIFPHHSKIQGFEIDQNITNSPSLIQENVCFNNVKKL